VICSATSEPQLKAIASEIETRLKEDHAIRPSQLTDFRPAMDVLDYLQVVVHVFHRDKRSFIAWRSLGDALRLDWETVVTAR